MKTLFSVNKKNVSFLNTQQYLILAFHCFNDSIDFGANMDLEADHLR